ncbi:GNAT family N-acetyltransferase [Methanocalculus sp.]|uniref:GNAT family N-acetyltransferase n=1 Tax=Methanocalculus sp. TaxID=2004547 RepID=UPI002636E0E4|nr:GNAT family N-acetyltransferase [Methanocalculus sp.]MDG6249243.1 GNAT family N-acetyltransferase [Methanocalculus sp.]
MNNVPKYSIHLRKATKNDCELVHRWINEEETRENSFSKEFIDIEEHTRWFFSKLIDPNHIYYLAINENNVPVGQIRFSIQDDEAVVSVLVDENFRKKGLGEQIISLGSHRFFEETSIGTIHAYVKEKNSASIKAFVNAGYIPKGTVSMHNQCVNHFILERQAAQLLN